MNVRNVKTGETNNYDNIRQ